MNIPFTTNDVLDNTPGSNVVDKPMRVLGYLADQLHNEFWLIGFPPVNRKQGQVNSN